MKRSEVAHEKKTYIQILRCIAAFCVILNHVNVMELHVPVLSRNWYMAIITLFVSKIAVPIFLIISGGLLLGKIEDKNKHIKRILRWIAVIIIFTALYYLVYHHGKGYMWYEYIQRLFGGVTIAYWYLYLYLGILIMLPILQKIAVALSKIEIEFLIVISLFIGGGIPLVTTLMGIAVEHTFLDVVCSPYLGLMFCGYYIEKYLEIDKKKFLIVTTMFVSLISYQVIQTVCLCKIDSQNYLQLDNRIYVTITLSGVCVYIMLKYIFTKIKTPSLVTYCLNYLGSLTFGIYLLGDLFINLFWHKYIMHCSNNNSFVTMLIYTIFIYFLALVCTAVIKKIPIVKNLI